MPYSLSDFERDLRPTAIFKKYSDLFDAGCRIWDLIDRFGQHCKSLANRRPCEHDLEVLEGVMTVMAGLIRSLDAVMLLSCFGRSTEAEGLSRRIWESWWTLLLASTSPRKWFFLYNRHSKIALLGKTKEMRDHPERFGSLNSNKMAIMTNDLDTNFSALKTEFNQNGFDFAADLSDLCKRYRDNWCGLPRDQMQRIIEAHYGQDVGLRDTIQVSRTIAYPLLSQLLHGTGYFQTTIKKRLEGRINIYANRRDQGIDNVLLNSLYMAFVCLGTVIDRIPLGVPADLIEEITDHGKVISSLNRKYSKDHPT